MSPLILVVGIPALAALLMLAVPGRAHRAIRAIAFVATLIVLLLSSWIALGFHDAPSDGPNMVRLDAFGAILDGVLAVHRAVRSVR